MRIAVVSGDMRGREVVDALFADWLAVTENASLAIDTAEAWAGVLWRIGAETLRLHLLATHPLSAWAAIEWGIADSLVPAGEDPVEWVAGWRIGRNEIALESAAALIRRRGGDRLERAEFARLFAAGEPQTGLAAFLGKQRPKWRKDEG
jgi:enoyl-CoA hydratase/carnithine racemase